MAVYQVKDCTFTFDYKPSKQQTEVERLEGVIRNAKINLNENAERLARYEKQLADAKAKAKAEEDAKKDIGTRYADKNVYIYGNGRGVHIAGLVVEARPLDADEAEEYLRNGLAELINAACKEAVEEDRKARSKVRYYKSTSWRNSYLRREGDSLVHVAPNCADWSVGLEQLDFPDIVEITEAEAKAILKGGGK